MPEAPKKKFSPLEAISGFTERNKKTFEVIAFIAVMGVAVELEYSFLHFLNTPLDPSLLSLKLALQKDGILGNSNDDVLRQILAAGGFDKYNADGTSTHWEIIRDKGGLITDAHATTHHAFGSGPWFEEDLTDDHTHEGWNWHGPNVGRPEEISEAQYAAAATDYTHHGAHAFKPGEKLTPELRSKALAELSYQTNLQKGATGPDFAEFQKTGRFTDGNGRTWQLWVDDKHVFFTQMPPGHDGGAMRIEDDVAYTAKGKRIDPIK